MDYYFIITNYFSYLNYPFCFFIFFVLEMYFEDCQDGSVSKSCCCMSLMIWVRSRNPVQKKRTDTSDSFFDLQICTMAHVCPHLCTHIITKMDTQRDTKIMIHLKFTLMLIQPFLSFIIIVGNRSHTYL